jgi:hypothetical protein
MGQILSANGTSITVQDDFFLIMETFIRKNINILKTNGIRPEAIRIYMPLYVLELYQRWLPYYYGSSFHPHYLAFDSRFMDAKILDNYANTIVVSFENSQWHSNFEPAILQIESI